MTETLYGPLLGMLAMAGGTGAILGIMYLVARFWLCDNWPEGGS